MCEVELGRETLIYGPTIQKKNTPACMSSAVVQRQTKNATQLSYMFLLRLLFAATHRPSKTLCFCGRRVSGCDFPQDDSSVRCSTIEFEAWVLGSIQNHQVIIPFCVHSVFLCHGLDLLGHGLQLKPCATHQIHNPQ